MFDPRIKLDIAAAGALVPVHTYSTPDPDPSGVEEANELLAGKKK